MTTTKVGLLRGRQQVGLERGFTKISAPVEPPLAALRGLLPRGFNLVLRTMFNNDVEIDNYTMGINFTITCTGSGTSKSEPVTIVSLQSVLGN